MTEEQLKEIEKANYSKMACLDAEIRALRLEIQEAKHKYIDANCPLKVGDIATVISGSDNATKVCIHSISIRSDMGFEFKFGKIKKDGTPSQQSASVWWWKKVVLSDGREILGR